MTNCIDLQERFGDRYRVAYDESHEADRGPNARTHDPWLLTLPCRFGHIYPHGGKLLGASTDHRGPIANRLAALSCVHVVQDGDDGINVAFNVAAFDQVAAVMKPKRRRRLTPEHSAKLTTAGVAALALHRNSNDARSERRRDASPAVDSQAV